MTWTNLQTSFVVFGENRLNQSPVQEALAYIASQQQREPRPGKLTGRTKILGFADYNYREYALRWYHRLSRLGYIEQVIVAVDPKAVEFFSQNISSLSETIHWEALPYPPCIGYNHDPRGHRRQIFGRRWTYIYEQLQQGHHILMTDVDNVFFRFLDMKEFEDNLKVDVFHAYSTSYPTYVFEDMGLTVCGGMSWLRATPPVIRFVGSLVNKCKCMGLVGTRNSRDEQVCRECQCDDQVALNELLWKGKHRVIWDRNISKPQSLSDLQWGPLTGISSKTRHRIAIWDRNLAYRAPMPDTCPTNNWVAMPLYVDRSEVVEVWDALCRKTTT